MNLERLTTMNVSYEIYQYSRDYLEEQEKEHNFPAFRSLKELKTLNCEQPKLKNYTCIYKGVIETEYAETRPVLEQIYQKFNNGERHPVDYHGHSVSIGDVVVFKDNSAWFCDKIGWTKLTDFFPTRTEISEEKRNEYLNLLKEMYLVDGCEFGDGWKKVEQKLKHLQQLVKEMKQLDKQKD